MTPVELILSRLPDAKRNGHGWQACCPAHEDQNPSLSIADGDDGRALLKCHAGCATEDVVAALNLRMVDLMPVATGQRTGSSGGPGGQWADRKDLRLPRRTRRPALPGRQDGAEDLSAASAQGGGRLVLVGQGCPKECHIGFLSW